MNEPMRDVALVLAKNGLAVFPAFTIEHGRCSCGAAGCTSPGKHPIGSLVPRGVLNADTDPQMIREWWAVYPDANVGIATGDASGAVVLDIDVKSGGEASLLNLERKFGQVPDTWTAETGGGGFHFYFRMPAVDIRNSAGAVGPGIDVRGNGGYVIAPPSLHLSGRRYGWAPAFHPRSTPLAMVPAWLLERMAAKHALRTITTLPARINEGERNTWMTAVAGAMRRNGFCADAIYAAIAIENRRRCQPPLDDGELRRIAQSIERYPPAAQAG